MRVAAGVLAAICFLQNANADEIRLRCDPLKQNLQVSVLSIDITRISVQWGDASWIDNRQFQYQDGDDKPSDRSYRGFTACIFQVSQFVKFSSSKIEFGQSKISLNRCGVGVGADADFAPGEMKYFEHYTIDRPTGILYDASRSEMGVLNFGGEMEAEYQCQKFTGNVL